MTPNYALFDQTGNKLPKMFILMRFEETQFRDKRVHEVAVKLAQLIGRIFRR